MGSYNASGGLVLSQAGNAPNYTTPAAGYYQITGRGKLSATADGQWVMAPLSGASSSSLILGQTTGTSGIKFVQGNNVCFLYAGDQSQYANWRAATYGCQTSGSATAPTYFFASYGSTGIYFGTNAVNISNNNNLSASWDANGYYYSKRAPATKTSAYTVTVAESQTNYDNAGATGGITFTLPQIATANVGMTFSFFSRAAQAITLAPNAADAIAVIGSGAKAAGASLVSTAAIGATVTLMAQGVGQWEVVSLLGTWT